MTRDKEIGRRSLRALGSLTAPSQDEITCPTEAKARYAASRCHLANTEIGAVQTTDGWVGVVYLRADQGWMARIIREHGCRVIERKI